MKQEHVWKNCRKHCVTNKNESQRTLPNELHQNGQKSNNNRYAKFYQGKDPLHQLKKLYYTFL